MGFDKFMNTSSGQFSMSVVLGLGLSTLFRKACKERNCIVFKAPAFKEKDQDGNLISLTDFKGKQVILYFYPKDSTPGCTMEACSLRDEHTYLNKKNYVVLGVSADDEIKHKKFATKNELPFSLLADTEMKIIN